MKDKLILEKYASWEEEGSLAESFIKILEN